MARLSCALVTLAAISVSVARSLGEESWVESSNAIGAHASFAAGTKGYTFTVKLASKRHSESDAEISVSLVGTDGKQSDWGSLGNLWGADMMGKEDIIEVRLTDVGSPKELHLRTDSSDGTVFESVDVSASGTEDVYFDTSGTSVRCRHGWFGGSKRSKNCDSKFVPSAAPDESGHVACAEGTSVSPIKSSFKLPEGTVKLMYTGFIVYMDCSGVFGGHGAFRFEYTAHNDCGKLARRGSFSLDPKFEKTCQQKNGKAYPTHDGVSFDRGHLVPANHLDSDKEAIYQSNYMTNILPQVDKMNRGAWLRSEEIIECLRVTEQLFVVGGAVYDPDYDRYNWFEKSHNVKTPSFFWKVIKSQTLHPETGHYLALWVPNSVEAVKKKINDYVVSIAELEKMLAEYGQPQKFDIATSIKKITPDAAWALPFGCDPQ